MGSSIDLSGMKFGRLTVLHRVPAPSSTTSRSVFWMCTCDCGKNHITSTNSIRVGDSKSCGCLRNEQNAVASLKHGYAIKGHTPEYRSWAHMIQRCYNPNNDSYCYYGARGITVCPRWRNSFENFLQDMGRKPDPLLTIERINVNGNYEPGNCIWIPRSEQPKNTRRSLKNRGIN